MAYPNMDRLTRLDPLVALVSVPPILLAIAWLAVLATAGVTGRHPIFNLQARNLSEAVAFRDAGAVVRRIEAGEDPNRPAELRPDVIRSESVTLTPIETAAASRQADMGQLLFDLGASLDAGAWQRAWCISDEPEMRDLLASHRPTGAMEDCVEQ